MLPPSSRFITIWYALEIADPSTEAGCKSFMNLVDCLSYDAGYFRGTLNTTPRPEFGSYSVPLSSDTPFFLCFTFDGDMMHFLSFLSPTELNILPLNSITEQESVNR